MAELTLYGLKTCDTCRKAIKALEEAGHAVKAVDVRSDGVPQKTLKSWVAEHGQALVNTRSTTWRGLDEAARAKAESDPAALLAQHPTLIKRPVIENAGAVTVGWLKPVQATYGL
ncbi:MAG: ArsC/Spx/MgsR family protein [Pseudomonadota bacterium]